MDQGDNQLPIWQGDFGVDWSLTENDWPSGAAPFTAKGQNYYIGNGSSPLAFHSPPLARFPDESTAEDNSQLSLTICDPWVSPNSDLVPETSSQQKTTSLGWPMGHTFEPVGPRYDVPSAFGYLASPAFDYGNGQIGGVSLPNQWHMGNSINEAFLDVETEMRTGLLTSSDFTGFNEVKGLQLDRGSRKGEREGESTPAVLPRSAFSKGERKANRTKQRLACQHPECKSTFPRKYELERHKRNVHDRDFSVPCFVHGCKRIAKPFHRLDKLREHLRKHQNPDLTCFIDGCGDAHLTRGELKDHLLTKHDLKHCKQPHLGALLGILELRIFNFRGKTIRLQDNDMCPLAFLGCDRRFVDITFLSHLRGHDLLERSEGYEEIVQTCGTWTRYGSCTCPICHEKSTWVTPRKDFEPSDAAFVGHLAHHSKEERASHATVLSKMLRPYLIGKEICHDLFYMDVGHIFLMIRAELEEIEAIQAEGSIPHKESTAGDT